MSAPSAHPTPAAAPDASAAPPLGVGRLAGLSVALALAYFVAAKGAPLLFPAGNESALPVPAAGIAVAALLLWGAWLLPAILVACALVDLSAGVPPAAALLSAVLTVASFAVVFFLLDRVARIDRALGRIQDVLALAVLGAGTLVLFETARRYAVLAVASDVALPAAMGPLWIAALGAGVRMLVVAPPILTWHATRRVPIPRHQRIEAACLAAVTVAVGVVVFWDYFMPMIGSAEMPYAFFPLVFWAALRFGPREVSTVVLVAAMIAAAFTSHGQGPFAARAPVEGMVALYLFLAVLATTGLLFAAVLNQRAQADRLVRESEQQHRMLIESMNEGLVIHDANGVLTYVSERFCELTGYAREEVLGRVGHELVVPGERAKWIERHRLRSDGSREAFELTLAKKDGGPLPVQVSPRPLLDAKGDYAGGFALISDITERRLAEQALRESEEKFRLIVENQTDLVLKLDGERRVVFASPSYLAFFGKHEADVLGRPVDVQIHDEDWPAVAAARASVAVPPHTMTVEHRVVTPGGWRWLSWSARGSVDANGALTAIFAVARDVTDRRRAEEQARQHLQQLAHVSRVSSMGEMASAIAHEINQPLTAIANYAYACLRLLRSGEQDEVLPAMQRVATEAERAGEVVRKMRSFVRGDEGQLSAVEVGFLVSEVLRLAAPEARQSGVELVPTIPAKLPPVLADSIQIQQVLLNLVRNAVEAINAADPPLREVRIAAARSPGGDVEITVEDTGPGLAAEALERVFEPFYTTKPDGIGIGLALSRSIVDAHGGRLWATAAPGRGATFHLVLPIVPESGNA
ncbi:MAG TPA: PAS domain S-box protein [Burkholderiales bacterium]|nr:PAS domain S-box protein [Burkholderiales bacterium]